MKNNTEIFIKIFNDTIYYNNYYITYIEKSRIDNYPIYKIGNLIFDKNIINNFFNDYDKLIQYLRIFKLKQITKNITNEELYNLNILQFLKDNYAIITLINN